MRRDLRGHAHSSCPGPDYDYSLETVLGEIVDLLDQLGIQKVHVLRSAEWRAEEHQPSDRI